MGQVRHSTLLGGTDIYSYTFTTGGSSISAGTPLMLDSSGNVVAWTAGNVLIGVASSTVGSASPITVQLVKDIQGQLVTVSGASYTPGQKYYINAAGTLTTTFGYKAIYFGYAISATQILSSIDSALIKYDEGISGDIPFGDQLRSDAAVTLAPANTDLTVLSLAGTAGLVNGLIFMSTGSPNSTPGSFSIHMIKLTIDGAAERTLSGNFVTFQSENIAGQAHYVSPRSFYLPLPIKFSTSLVIKLRIDSDIYGVSTRAIYSVY